MALKLELKSPIVISGLPVEGTVTFDVGKSSQLPVLYLTPKLIQVGDASFSLVLPVQAKPSVIKSPSYASSAAVN